MEALALFLAPAALLWAAVIVWRCPLVVSCTIYLILACCLGGYFWSVDAAGLTWSLDRFFMALLVVAAVVAWKRGQADIKPFSRLDAVILAFTGLLLVSTFTHQWRTNYEGQDSILMHLANGYLVPLLIYAIVRNAPYGEKQQRVCWGLLALFGLYLALTAVFEVAGAWGLVFPRYIADPEAGIHWGRARGPFLQSARLGFYLVTCGALTWLWLLSFKSWGRFRFASAVAFLPLSALAMFFTYTRSVWMGAALATVVVIGLTWQGRWRALALYGLLVAVAVGVAIKGRDLVGFQRETSAAVTRESAYSRAAFAYVSWQMFLDKPLVGHGFGQFRKNSRYYLSDRETALRLEGIRGYINHCTFLNQLAEMGVFGPLLYTAILGYWMVYGWQLCRRWDAPRWARNQGLLMLLTLAPYFFQLLFREVTYSPVENALVFYMAGLTVSLHHRYAPSVSAIPRNLARQPKPAV